MRRPLLALHPRSVGRSSGTESPHAVSRGSLNLTLVGSLVLVIAAAGRCDVAQRWSWASFSDPVSRGQGQSACALRPQGQQRLSAGDTSRGEALEKQRTDARAALNETHFPRKPRTGKAGGVGSG